MRDSILRELHATHLGMVKIKMFARTYVRWPGIDRDIATKLTTAKDA